MKFLNMTQHVVRLLVEEKGYFHRLEPCGTVVRVVPKFKPMPIGSVKDVPIISTSFINEDGELSITGLDVNSLDGDTIYIVSTIAAQVIRKPNVVSPATIDEWVVRYTADMSEADKSPFGHYLYWPECAGQVFGVRALQCFY